MTPPEIASPECKNSKAEASSRMSRSRSIDGQDAMTSRRAADEEPMELLEKEAPRALRIFGKGHPEEARTGYLLQQAREALAAHRALFSFS
jgi:hypothetical protein